MWALDTLFSSAEGIVALSSANEKLFLLARGGGGGGGRSNERQLAEADYRGSGVDCRTKGGGSEGEREHCCRWEKSSKTNGALMDGDTRQL